MAFDLQEIPVSETSLGNYFRDANACSRDNPVRHEDILALYQRWLTNHDPIAERQLRELGISLGGSDQRQ